MGKNKSSGRFKKQTNSPQHEKQQNQDNQAVTPHPMEVEAPTTPRNGRTYAKNRILTNQTLHGGAATAAAVPDPRTVALPKASTLTNESDINIEETDNEHETDGSLSPSDSFVVDDDDAFLSDHTPPAANTSMTAASPPAARNSGKHQSYVKSLQPKRIQMLRYDLKITVLPSEDPRQELQIAIQRLIDELIKIDDTVVVYPWSQEEQRTLPARIDKATQVPSSILAIRSYFARAYAKPEGGTLYVSALIGSTTSMGSLMTEIDYWLREHRYGIYKKALQVQDTVIAGWALYSTRTIDTEALKAAIHEAHGLQIGIRWRMISNGKRGPTSTADQVRALHFEVNASSADADCAALFALYATNRNEGFPNGIKLRLVPNMTDLMNAHSRTKSLRLVQRQAAFLENIQAATTWEIAVLDYRDRNLKNCTLRDLIMSIRSIDHPTMSLFFAVDRHWKGEGYIFNFLPQFESEARATMTSLLPYLRHMVGPGYDSHVNKFFTPSAIARAEGAVWDETSQTVRSLKDRIVDELMDCDMECQFTRLPASIEDAPVDNTMANNTQAISIHTEDSVSTFRSQVRNSNATVSSSLTTEEKMTQLQLENKRLKEQLHNSKSHGRGRSKSAGRSNL